jgi:hypothetical protein
MSRRTATLSSDKCMPVVHVRNNNVAFYQLLGSSRRSRNHASLLLVLFNWRLLYHLLPATFRPTRHRLLLVFVTQSRHITDCFYCDDDWAYQFYATQWGRGRRDEAENNRASRQTESQGYCRYSTQNTFFQAAVREAVTNTVPTPRTNSGHPCRPKVGIESKELSPVRALAILKPHVRYSRTTASLR